MSKILRWLTANPGLNLTICAAYFLLVVLPHEQIGAWIYATFFPGDIDTYNFQFLVAALLGSLVFLLPLYHNLKEPTTTRHLSLTYLSATLVLMVLSYFTIFVLATELVHFPQYALMAILLFPLTHRYRDSLYWATLLGAVDEAYQYFYLAPQRTTHFDFNDVVINCIGAGFGLVFLYTLRSEPSAPAPRRWWKSPPLWATGAITLIVTALIQSGLLTIFPSEADPDGTVLLFREIPKGFWSKFHHIRYHVIMPLEGLLILGLLWLFYSRLDRTPKAMSPAFPPINRASRPE